jgi:succinate dehydrogenase/fumarate reductase flavoprotein subunit
MIHDVVVIGAGIAGMVAARRSQQLGARVVVLDKTPRPLDPRDPGSNSRKSGGLFHAAYRDPRRWSPDDLYRDLIRKTDGQVRHELVRAWADNVLAIITGVTFTMGGLLVNAHAQVLDEQEHPIPALYAAGGTMGGLQGGPRNGYSGGWLEATTFGLLAAEHATSTLRDG